MRTAYILSWCCVVFFIVALFGPSVTPDMGAWNRPEAKPIPGWFAAAIAWPYYLPNAALILGPLLIFLSARMRRAKLMLSLLLGIYAITPFTLVLSSGSIRSIGWGFYLWCSTHLLAALATGIAIAARSHQAKETEQPIL